MEESVQWGVLYQAPNIDQECEEVCRSLLDARLTAGVVARNLGVEPRVVYRAVCRGAWQSDMPGDEYAVRFAWADGHVEFRRMDGREDAERRVRNHGRYDQAGSVADVVSRSVTYGQWRLASAEVTA